MARPAKAKRDGRRQIEIPDRALRMEVVPTGNLKAMPGHSRPMQRRQVKRVRDSIEKLGYLTPILADDEGNILCGYVRWEAAKQAGLKEVSVVRASGMTLAEKRAYRIMENRLGELGEWDTDALAEEFQFLLDEDFELEFTGFDTPDIDRIMSSREGAGQETIDLPSAEEPVVSVLGDLWGVGEHRLVCGDTRDPAVCKRLFGGHRAQMVFIDPPYNVEVGGNVAGIRKKQHRDFAMASGEMTREEYLQFLRSSIEQVAAFSLAGAIIYVCIDWRHLEDVLAATRAVGLEFKQLVVWSKTNAGMGSFYRSQHELIPIFKLLGGEHVNNIGFGGRGQLRSNVWTYCGANGYRKGRSEDLQDHPTIKPTAMVADAIKDCSRRRGTVFDSFAGSGTTLVAAERTGRRGYGIEIDPAYVDVALRRLERETGLEPVLETGETFSEVAAQRLGKEAA